jgi:hypothetical protein
MMSPHDSTGCPPASTSVLLHVQQVSTTSYPMSASQIVHDINIWKILIDETFDIE